MVIISISISPRSTKIMDVKMKCSHKKGQKECKYPVSFTCFTCKIPEYYCKRHAGEYNIENKHEIISIQFDLCYLKMKIKSCISNIAQNTDAIITEIRRISLKTITQLKKLIRMQRL